MASIAKPGLLKHLIDRTNRERNPPYPPEDCRIKFLELIDTPQALVDKAIAQMQQSTYLMPNGQPSYEMTCAAFDELWRTYFNRGDVKYRAPASTSGPPSNRVDAMQMAVDFGFEEEGTLDRTSSLD